MAHTKTNDLVQIALMTAMLAVSSIFVIPIGPVPVTLQTFFFILIPALLGTKKGCLSISLYLFIGLLGMPVFAGGNGGLQSLFSPSFGYIIGAIAASFLIGRAERRLFTFWQMIILSLGGLGIIYAFGIGHAYWVINGIMETPITLPSLTAMNLTGFLPLDCLKAAGAAAVYRRLSFLNQPKKSTTIKNERKEDTTYYEKTHYQRSK